MVVYMDFNELRDQAYKNAVKHGWHDEEKPIEHWLCLIISELSEAVEADRKNHRADMATFRGLGRLNRALFDGCFEVYIKDSLEDELADVIIRALDLAGMLGVNLDCIRKITNSTKVNQEYFTIRIYRIQSLVVHIGFAKNREYPFMLLFEAVFALAADYGIDLIENVSLKMKYNEDRPYMHGKKY